MKIKTTYIHLILMTIFTFTESINILVVMPHIGKSHQLVFEPLFKKLTEKHKLTVITRYPQKNPGPNRRDINIAPDYLDISDTEILSFNNFTGSRIEKYTTVNLLAFIAHQACKDGLSHPNYMKFLKENNHFDLILIEVFNTPCFMGVAKKFNAPMIGLSSCMWLPWTFKWFGSDSNPSYVPNHFLDHTDRMSFLARVENTLIHIYSNIVYNSVIEKSGRQISKEYTDIDFNENGDIMGNISLLLINTHFILNSRLPMSPNSIGVGGIHVDSVPVKPLPQDLERIVNDSKHGVIFMSMGSTLRGDSFPEDKKQAFLKAFSRIPQRIVWKWEGEMKNKPENVFTYRWVPQRDILCHPNTKLFISHGGLLGTIETINCGKPVLFLPQFGDQFANAAAVEQNGGGLVLNMNDVNDEILYEKLQILLSTNFSTSAKELSIRYKDRPLSPMDTALYWIEYVWRHKGAHFMKIESVDMPLYKYYLLDVITFLSIIASIVFYVIYVISKYVLTKLFIRQEKIKSS